MYRCTLNSPWERMQMCTEKVTSRWFHVHPSFYQTFSWDCWKSVVEFRDQGNCWVYLVSHHFLQSRQYIYSIFEKRCCLKLIRDGVLGTPNIIHEGTPKGRSNRWVRYLGFSLRSGIHGGVFLALAESVSVLYEYNTVTNANRFYGEKIMCYKSRTYRSCSESHLNT